MKSRATDTAGPVRIAALGDIMLGGPCFAAGALKPPVLAGGDFLRRADLVLGNLEAPFGHPGMVAAREGTRFWAPVETAGLLRHFNVHVVSLANNHIFDCGWEGFETTRRTLKQAGISCCGAGRDLREARSPASFLKKGMRVDVFAYSWTTEWDKAAPAAGKRLFGVAPLREDIVREDLESSRADLKVVLLHWGEEDTVWPTPSGKRLARALLAAGADIVLGGHPHAPQAVWRRGGRIVAYSLGNFFFGPETFAGGVLALDGPIAGHAETARRRTGMALEVTAGPDGAAREVTLHSVTRARGRADALEFGPWHTGWRWKLYQRLANLPDRAYRVFYPVLRRADELVILACRFGSWSRLKRFRPRHLGLISEAARLVLRPNRL